MAGKDTRVSEDLYISNLKPSTSTDWLVGYLRETTKDFKHLMRLETAASVFREVKCAYVSYKSIDAATTALHELKGQPLGPRGTPIDVGFVISIGGMETVFFSTSFNFKTQTSEKVESKSGDDTTVAQNKTHTRYEGRPESLEKSGRTKHTEQESKRDDRISFAKGTKNTMSSVVKSYQPEKKQCEAGDHVNESKNEKLEKADAHATYQPEKNQRDAGNQVNESKNEESAKAGAQVTRKSTSRKGVAGGNKRPSENPRANSERIRKEASKMKTPRKTPVSRIRDDRDKNCPVEPERRKKRQDPDYRQNISHDHDEDSKSSRSTSKTSHRHSKANMSPSNQSSEANKKGNHSVKKSSQDDMQNFECRKEISKHSERARVKGTEKVARYAKNKMTPSTHARYTKSPELKLEPGSGSGHGGDASLRTSASETASCTPPSTNSRSTRKDQSVLLRISGKDWEKLDQTRIHDFIDRTISEYVVEYKVVNDSEAELRVSHHYAEHVLRVLDCRPLTCSGAPIEVKCISRPNDMANTVAHDGTNDVKQLVPKEVHMIAAKDSSKIPTSVRISNMPEHLTKDDFRAFLSEFDLDVQGFQFGHTHAVVHFQTPAKAVDACGILRRNARGILGDNVQVMVMRGARSIRGHGTSFKQSPTKPEENTTPVKTNVTVRSKPNVHSIRKQREVLAKLRKMEEDVGRELDEKRHGLENAVTDIENSLQNCETAETHENDTLETTKQVLQSKLDENRGYYDEFKHTMNKMAKDLEDTIPDCQGQHGRRRYVHKIDDIRRRLDRERRRLRNPLPIYSRRTKILDIVTNPSTRACVIRAETGSGKSTQVPQYLMESLRTQSTSSRVDKGIVCAQPRRVAAMTLARRIADEYDCKVGQEVGFIVGRNRKITDKTLTTLMTDRTLMNFCLEDPKYLEKYRYVIIDEAHERSVDMDILLAMLKRQQVQNKQFTMIIMSATIDTELFSRYFDDCPVIDIPGRTFPVDVEWCPCLDGQTMGNDDYVYRAVARSYNIHMNEECGDILVFLTSQFEIDLACRLLKRKAGLAKTEHKNDNVQILPIHGKLPPREQFKVFKKPRGHQRKIIFATNIAETSVTIPDVKYVIDTGLVKEFQYDAKKSMSFLKVTNVSKASAEQRRGRGGRRCPGKCYRMYSQEEFQEMDQTTKPEILRVHLGMAVMKILQMGVREIDTFDFIESPDDCAIEQAIQTMVILGAVNDRERTLTDLGKQMAKLPVEPRLAKIILEGAKRGVLDDAVTMVALISAPGNVFYQGENDAERKEADQVKMSLCVDEGDVITLLGIFREWQGIPIETERNKWCKDHYLNAKTLKQVQENVDELHVAIKQSKVFEDGDTPECNVKETQSQTTEATWVENTPAGEHYLNKDASSAEDSYQNVQITEEDSPREPVIEKQEEEHLPSRETKCNTDILPRKSNSDNFESDRKLNDREEETRNETMKQSGFNDMIDEVQTENQQNCNGEDTSDISEGLTSHTGDVIKVERQEDSEETSKNISEQQSTKLCERANQVVNFSDQSASEKRSRGSQTPNDVLRKVLLSAYFDNLSVFNGHKQAGYTVASQLKTAVFHPSSALAALNINPAWVIYVELRRTSNDFMCLLTPVEIEWIHEVAPTEFSQHVDLEKLKSCVMTEVKFDGIGTAILKILSKNQFECIRNLEDEISTETKAPCIIEVNADQGLLTVFIATHGKEIAEELVKISLERIQKKFQREQIEIPIGTRCNVRHVVKSGGETRFVLMDESQYVTVEWSGVSKDMPADVLCQALEGFGIKEDDIVEVQTNPKHFTAAKQGKWGTITFASPQKARDAVDLGSDIDPSGNVSGKPVLLERNQRDVTTDSRAPTKVNLHSPVTFKTRLSVTWHTRPSRGHAFVNCFTPEDAEYIIDKLNDRRDSTYLANKLIHCSISTKSNMSVYLSPIHRAVTKEDLENLITNKTSRDRFENVFIPREEIQDGVSDATHEERLRDMFRDVCKEIININILEDRSGKALLRKAYIDLEPNLGREQRRELKYVVNRGYPRGFDNAHYRINQATTCVDLFCSQDVLKVAEDEIRLLATRWKFSRLEVEFKDVKKTPWKKRIHISGEYYTDVEEFAPKVQNILSPEKMDARRLVDEDVTPMWMGKVLSRLTKQHLKDMLDGNKVHIEISVRRQTIKLYGKEEDREALKDDLRSYISNAMKNVFKEVNVTERAGGQRGHAMRSLIRRYGPHLKNLKTATGVDSITVDLKRGLLFVEGSEESYESLVSEVDDVLKRLDKAAGDSCETSDECEACFYPPVKVDSMPYRLAACGHFFCLTCLKEHVKESVNSRKFPIACPGCDDSIMLCDIKTIVANGDERQQLYTTGLETYVASNGDIKFCPGPDCCMVFRKTGNGGAMKCKECGFRYCGECGEEPHPHGMTCKEAEISETKTTGVEKWMKENDVDAKICLACKAIIEKNRGCNHIVCRCKKHICWNCLEVFNTERECYNHLHRAHGGINEANAEVREARRANNLVLGRVDRLHQVEALRVFERRREVVQRREAEAIRREADRRAEARRELREAETGGAREARRRRLVENLREARMRRDVDRNHLYVDSD